MDIRKEKPRRFQSTELVVSKHALPKKSPTAHSKGLSSETAEAWTTTFPDSGTQEPTGRTQKVRPSMPIDLTTYRSVTGVITHSSRPIVGRINSVTLAISSASTNINPVCAGRQAPPTKYSIPNSLHRAGQSETVLIPSFLSSKCVPQFSGV